MLILSEIVAVIMLCGGMTDKINKFNILDNKIILNLTQIIVIALVIIGFSMYRFE